MQNLKDTSRLYGENNLIMGVGLHLCDDGGLLFFRGDNQLGVQHVPKRGASTFLYSLMFLAIRCNDFRLTYTRQSAGDFPRLITFSIGCWHGKECQDPILIIA